MKIFIGNWETHILVCGEKRQQRDSAEVEVHCNCQTPLPHLREGSNRFTTERFQAILLREDSRKLMFPNNQIISLSSCIRSEAQRHSVMLGEMCY